MIRSINLIAGSKGEWHVWLVDAQIAREFSYGVVPYWRRAMI